jgi:hypothetical protein
MNDFGYSQLPARVIFGFGTIARIPDEARTLGCRRVLVLRDPHHANNAPRQVCLTSRLPLVGALTIEYNFGLSRESAPPP